MGNSRDNDRLNESADLSAATRTGGEHCRDLCARPDAQRLVPERHAAGEIPARNRTCAVVSGCFVVAAVLLASLPPLRRWEAGAALAAVLPTLSPSENAKRQGYGLHNNNKHTHAQTLTHTHTHTNISTRMHTHLTHLEALPIQSISKLLGRRCPRYCPSSVW